MLVATAWCGITYALIGGQPIVSCEMSVRCWNTYEDLVLIWFFVIDYFV